MQFSFSCSLDAARLGQLQKQHLSMNSPSRSPLRLPDVWLKGLDMGARQLYGTSEAPGTISHHCRAAGTNMALSYVLRALWRWWWKSSRRSDLLFYCRTQPWAPGVRARRRWFVWQIPHYTQRWSPGTIRWWKKKKKRYPVSLWYKNLS